MANLENINDIKNIKNLREKTKTINKKPKKNIFIRILSYILGGLIGLFVILLITLNLNITKDWIAQKAIEALNKDFNVKISANQVKIDFFGDVNIHNLKVKDNHQLDFISVPLVEAKSDWIGLIGDAVKGTNHFKFKEINLKNPDIQVITYKNDSIANFIRFVESFDNGKPRDPKKPIFRLNSKINIDNAKLSIINENSKGDAGRWLKAKNLDLHLSELQIAGVKIDAKLDNFSFETQRWGKIHKVEKFATHFTLDNHSLALKNLTFKTDHSDLKGNLTFILNEKTKWQDFNNKVRWNMHLENGSRLAGYDISYFATNWDNYSPIRVSGKMHGILNNFSLNDFAIGNENVNIRTKKISLKNILNGNFHIKTNDISTDFTYINLKKMMPSFVKNKMKNIADDFGRLNFKGGIDITPKRIIVPSGNLITGIGNADIQNFQLSDFSTNTPKYTGNFIIENLNTAIITKNKQVGNISGTFWVKGQSFDVNNMILDTKSHISSIEILDKKLKNIYLNGQLNHKTYKGDIKIQDSEIQGNVNGLIDFSTQKIAADIKANIQKFNPSYFSNKLEHQSLSGDFNGKISMSNLNDLAIDTQINNIKFHSSSQNIEIPNGTIRTYIKDNQRFININMPDAINGEIFGRFNLSDFAGMIQNGIDRILVSPQPRQWYKNQYFQFNFDIHQDFVNSFVQNIQLPQNLHIYGNYNGTENNLNFSANTNKLNYLIIEDEIFTKEDKELARRHANYVVLPTLKIDSATAKGISIKINTSEAYNEQISANFEQLNYKNNIFKNFSLIGKKAERNLDSGKNMIFQTQFDYANKGYENTTKNYAINFTQTFNEFGDYVFQFYNTNLNFNNINWRIGDDGNLPQSIVYRRKTGNIEVNNLLINSEDSKLFIEKASYGNKQFEISGNIDGLQIAKLFEMQDSGNPMDFQGVANGNFHILKNEKSIEPIITLNIDKMKMGGREMGNLNISAVKTERPNIYKLDVLLHSAGVFGDNKLIVSGTIDNNLKTPTLDIETQLNKFDLGFAQQFVNGVFSNIRGVADGSVRISGPIDNIDYNGEIALSKFGLKLDFTGVDYSFEDTKLPFSKGFVALNDIKIKDGRNVSDGSISGFIQFETLDTMGVNLIIRAANLMMLNSTQADNDLFWGKVQATGDLFVSGPIMGLDISTPNMRALNNSSFTFNSSSTTKVDEYKMLRFLKRTTEGKIELAKKKKTGANMNIDFTVSADKGTLVNVLVGGSMGDISVRGDAKAIRFKMNRSGNISLNGNYIVDSGEFVSKMILERKFQIVKGSNLSWTGNPMTPQLNIKATYEKVVTNMGEYLGTSLPSLNVQLITNITGTMNKPDLKFNIDIPEVSSQIRETLNTKISNEDEKVIQFGSILALGSFNVSNSGGFDVKANSLQSSGYGILLKQLSSILNTISKNVKIDLDYLAGDQTSNTSDRASSRMNVNISPRLKIIGNIGIPILKTDASSISNNYLTTEGTIEYDFSKNIDGSLLVKGFSKPSNIGLIAGNTGANQTSGIGVVYNTSFNNILRSKKDSTETKKNNPKR